MTNEELIALLWNKDYNKAYAALKEVEAASSCYYDYFEQGVKLLQSGKNLLIVRGARFIASLALYDVDNKIDNILPLFFEALASDKVTQVRQVLASLSKIIKVKPALRQEIKEELSHYYYASISDSSKSLIAKDILKIIG